MATIIIKERDAHRVHPDAPGRTDTHLFDHWREDQKFDASQGLLEAEDIARCVRFMLEQPDEVLIPRMLVVPARQPR